MLSLNARRFLVGLLVVASPALAEGADAVSAPRFRLPVACVLGDDCFIQNYFDHDPGSGWRDYACGSLSYDEHRGTDFRVKTLADMESGTAVIAAADGVVKALRDGEPDVPVSIGGRARVKGREAGNGVVLDHGDGWETQYSHLRKGSIRVARGQRIKAGDMLGLIGFSGNTAFPHVDFVVRHRGRAVDPFRPSGDDGCAMEADTLWHPEILASLSYQASGVLQSGWGGDAISPAAIRAERLPPAPTAESRALTFWVEVFGIRSGDREHLEIHAPDGQRVAESVAILPRNNAVRIALLVLSRPADGWQAGDYRARYRLSRGGELLRIDSDFRMPP